MKPRHRVTFSAAYLVIVLVTGLGHGQENKNARHTKIDGAGIRGVTLGPIENTYHPNVGYGSAAFERSLSECSGWGATWISITPFGRVADISGGGVDLTFEAPFAENVKNIERAIGLAHARGLRVFLVPHLWVESFEWRALIDPKTDDGWARFAASYRDFILTWARVAEMTHADLFSSGVELESWVTSGRAPSFLRILNDIRTVYRGPVTYSANWDDVEETVVLGALDVIGINAFFPLADQEGAEEGALRKRGEAVREKIRKLSATWRKPVLFTELGYTTRKNPAIKPWEWPDQMSHVIVDETAQALAYRSLLAPMLDEPSFAGFFVWRMYSDPDDVSQEAEWGFSPRGKMAELVVRDAFATRWSYENSQR